MPFETSEVTDFDNVIVVMGNDDGKADNPPTLFIVRNLRHEGGKTPVIHVWKSVESFEGRSAMIKGGLTNREIQIQIMLRRILSHRMIGQGKSYTIDSLPSHTVMVNPTFVERDPVTKESKRAKCLLQNATNFASKLRGETAHNDRDNQSKGQDSDKKIHPIDAAYVGKSPLLTLMTAFLLQGLDPLHEPRGSLSKVKSVQEFFITRQDFCELVCEIRDFLYCFYDTDYFDVGEQRNQTLT